VISLTEKRLLFLKEVKRMARDKAKDDQLFNCQQEYEIDYVANLYTNSDKVKAFLKAGCKKGDIKNLTHEEVYKLIEKELNYSMPN